jgi:hypothetical protein
MNPSRVVLASFFAAAVSLAAPARAQGATPAATPPKSPSQSKEDCQKANAARHDHGKEKGGGSMAAMPCPPAAAASAVTANKPHNHGTFNKNQ